MCAQSCPTLCDPMDFSVPGSSFLEFSRQEYLSKLLFPSPGDLPSPEMEPISLASPALAGRFFTTEPPGEKCMVREKFPGNCKVENYQSDFLWVNIKTSYWKHRTCNGNLCSDFYHRIFLLDSEGLVMLVKECFVSACKVTATQGWEAGGEVRKG